MERIEDKEFQQYTSIMVGLTKLLQAEARVDEEFRAVFMDDSSGKNMLDCCKYVYNHFKKQTDGQIGLWVEPEDAVRVAKEYYLSKDENESENENDEPINEED